MIFLELPNVPVAWAAARVSSKGSYNPKRAEKDFTRWQIRSLYRGDPIPGYVVVEFLFVFPFPNSIPLSQRARYLGNVKIIPTKSDTTNLQKFYEDCIKDIVITDDRNVAKISSEKIYGIKGKVLIKVFTLEEYRNLNENTAR